MSATKARSERRKGVAQLWELAFGRVYAVYGGVFVWGGGGTAITQVERIPVGTLIVDIGDLSSKRYIWRGTATKTISSKPDKNAKAIDEAVKKMFEKFPPEARE